MVVIYAMMIGIGFWITRELRTITLLSILACSTNNSLKVSKLIDSTSSCSIGSCSFFLFHLSYKSKDVTFHGKTDFLRLEFYPS